MRFFYSVAPLSIFFLESWFYSVQFFQTSELHALPTGEQGINFIPPPRPPCSDFYSQFNEEAKGWRKKKEIWEGDQMLRAARDLSPPPRVDMCVPDRNIDSHLLLR